MGERGEETGEPSQAALLSLHDFVPTSPPPQPNVSKCTYLGLSIGTTCLRPHTLGAACTTSRQGHRAAGFCAQVSLCRHLPAWTRLSKSDVCPELPGLLPGGSSLMETLMPVISSKSCVKTTLSSCDPDFVRSQRFTFCYTLWKAVAVKSTFSFLSFIFFIILLFLVCLWRKPGFLHMVKSTSC